MAGRAEASGPVGPDTEVPWHAGAAVGKSLQALGLDVRPLPEPDPGTAVRAQVGTARPALFRGLVGHWPALANWTPWGLAARHGDTAVRALVDLPSSGVLFPQDQRFYERELTFGELVSTMMVTGPESPCYLAYKRAHDIFPDTDHDFPGLLGELDRGADTRAWIGSAGTRSMLHSDLKDNLFVQIWGEKHVVLVPWRHSRAVYPFHDNVVNSQVDLDGPDPDRQPRLRRAVFHAGVVRPGDVLFIPRGWWHDIRSFTPSVSLNHWFGPPLGLRNYLGLVTALGPRCWAAVVRDFVRVGVIGKPEVTSFFFSPPATGKRLFDALRWGSFSRGNDPSQ